MNLLAWMPFVQPMPGVIHWWWLLIVPMVTGVSVAWKAIRMPSLERYWREVGFMTVQVLLGMVALAAGLMVLVRVVLPLLPAD
jgi:hypothetical protein